MDEWRQFLYPIGFISSLFFGARILVQWLSSELKQKSVTPKLFWQISLLGNLFLSLHSLIQIQFHVYLIQMVNGFISWRNLDLMKKEESRLNLKKTLFLFFSLILSSIIFFFLFNHLGGETFSSWFRIPTSIFHHSDDTIIHPIWHFFGFIGLTLFSSRFWIQWIYAEKEQKSSLNQTFWILSLIGDLCVLFYFFKIKDPVNLVGPIFGLIPYIRNLMLIKQTKEAT